MDRFQCIQAFVRVAETRSFVEAARQLACEGETLDLINRLMGREIEMWDAILEATP